MTRKPLDSKTKTPSARPVFFAGIIVIAAAAATATIGISNRAKSIQEVTRWTNEQAIPTVAVVTPMLAPGQDELVLPGNIEAYYTGLIFGRASGYVKQWRRTSAPM
jgi:membrane fusion protein, multidrug efflux system